jgi:hypothetical protein
MSFLDKWSLSTKVAAALVLILAIALVVWIFSGSGSGKIERLETNRDVHKGEAGVISNLVTNQQQEVNGAAKQTNEGIGNFHSSVNRDSSTFNGNGTDRFCERFPNDSTCDEWRRQHNR